MDELLTEEELRFVVGDLRAGRPLRTFAQTLGGVTFQTLGKFLNGDKPGQALPSALGYEPVTMYRKLPSTKKRK